MSIEAITLSIAQQGFAGLLGNLATSYVKRKSKFLSSNPDDIKTNFHDHLNNTFNKCSEIKTILSDKKSEKTLALYVDQIFSSDGTDIDQYTLVEKIKKGCATIITGTGGGGKSMFMRYLWLSFFENPNGKIPFFLELRQLNFLTHTNMIDFIYHSILKSGSSISQENFIKSLKNGEFVVFLDGFDEINHDQRSKIENMILALRENYPLVTIIVTSRPDERFNGWHHFDICKVSPLTKYQVVQLIKKANYIEEYKSLFLKQIDSLYGSHKTFLETPLLAYMMLVTFSYNKDIPQRMFQFYEQAFEALYTRHDLTKGGYKRQLYTGLERQKLIRLISFFCLKSYYDEEFEFTENEINGHIEAAKTIEGLDVVNDDFKRDLSESLCLIKKEGIIYSFTHRSFQEYFAANCIARVASRNVEELFDVFANRYNDSVLKMVYDINIDLFREKYIIPSHKMCIRFFKRKRINRIFEHFAEATELSIEYKVENLKESLRLRTRNKKLSGRKILSGPRIINMDGKLFNLYQNIFRISNNKPSIDISELHELDIQFENNIARIIRGIDIEYIRIVCVSGKFIVKDVEKEISDKIVNFFYESGYFKYMKINSEYFFNFVNNEVINYNKMTVSFDKYF